MKRTYGTSIELSVENTAEDLSVAAFKLQGVVKRVDLRRKRLMRRWAVESARLIKNSYWWFGRKPTPETVISWYTNYGFFRSSAPRKLVSAVGKLDKRYARLNTMLKDINEVLDAQDLAVHTGAKTFTVYNRSVSSVWTALDTIDF